MSERMPKVNELIRQELGKIINEEMEFPAGVLVTITEVKTSSDLKYAKVLVSVMPLVEADQAIRRLNNYGRHLQQALNDKVTFRFVPKLSFVFDDSEERAADIDQLLDNLK